MSRYAKEASLVIAMLAAMLGIWVSSFPAETEHLEAQRNLYVVGDQPPPDLGSGHFGAPDCGIYWVGSRTVALAHNGIVVKEIQTGECEACR